MKKNYFIRVIQEAKDARGEMFIKIAARGEKGVRDFVKKKASANVLRVEVNMKKLILLIAAVAALGFAAQPAKAGVHVGVGIGIGAPYYGYGPYYGYPYAYPYGYPYYGGPAVGVYFGPGYYPWYSGYWHGGYYRGGYRGGYYHHR